MALTGRNLILGVSTSALVIAGGIHVAERVGGQDLDAQEQLTNNERDQKEISRLRVELGLAATALDTGQVAYMAYIEALPEDCRKAVLTFVPPEGPLTNISDEDATTAVTPWCGPDNLGAVSDLREDFKELQNLRSLYEVAGLNLDEFLGNEPAPVDTGA